MFLHCKGFTMQLVRFFIAKILILLLLLYFLFYLFYLHSKFIYILFPVEAIVTGKLSQGLIKELDSEKMAIESKYCPRSKDTLDLESASGGAFFAALYLCLTGKVDWEINPIPQGRGLYIQKRIKPNTDSLNRICIRPTKTICLSSAHSFIHPKMRPKTEGNPS